MRTIKYLFVIVVATACLLESTPSQASRMLQFHDSTHNYIAAAYIASNSGTGWNDPTIYTGDLLGYRYHILIAIKDTAKFQSLFDHCDLDSAKLSVWIGAKTGAPGDLNLHFIERDSTGMGVYPAYDDSRSYYCRSEWFERKGGTIHACPDSIHWEVPGATGMTDYNPTPFATVAQPQFGNRYDIDVTPWIAGVIAGTDSVSNGIMLLTSNENGAGTDYIGIRSFWPFTSGADLLILKIWVSKWDWVKVRLDSNRVSDGWITADHSDTIYSDSGYLKVGTGSSAPLQNDVGVISPDDTTLFGPDAIPSGYTVDSARVWLHLDDMFPAPNDTIVLGEFLSPAVYETGRFPTWDSAAPGVDWSGGTWSTADVARRDIQYVDAINTWYSWSVGTAVQRWLDSAATRHGLALWDQGPLTTRSGAWIDRTDFGFGAKAGSLLVWISPLPPRFVRRAWLDNPSPLK